MKDFFEKVKESSIEIKSFWFTIILLSIIVLGATFYAYLHLI